MPEDPAPEELAELERQAIALARRAGDVLISRFGQTVAVEFKDEKGHDPVTEVDRMCQDLIASDVAERYPGHGFLGEEDPECGDEATAPELVWVVDPLDGTKNYLNGLPLFSCSIGVLRRGVPVAAAVYLPWPGQVGGVVMHARAGAGTHVDGRPVPRLEGTGPEGGRLASVPGPFNLIFRPGQPLRDRIGEVRATGSIAYEVAMAARGVVQFTVTAFPRIWDVAAGVLLVAEAGGAVLAGSRVPTLGGVGPERLDWEPLTSFTSSGPRATTLGDMRKWSAPLILGSPGIAGFVAKHLRRRSRPHRALLRALRPFRPRRK